jgi:hypothetical protein
MVTADLRKAGISFFVKHGLLHSGVPAWSVKTLGDVGSDIRLLYITYQTFKVQICTMCSNNQNSAQRAYLFYMILG